MLNYKLATIFANLAEIAKGSRDTFDAVMAYTRAARTVRDYTDDIEKAYSEGKVASLAGITPMTYKIIEEYIKTGKIKEYEKFKEIYSDELIRFIRISGLGKKRIFYIYETLGAKNTTDLTEAISGRDIYKKLLGSKMPSADFITRAHIDRLIHALDYYEKNINLFPAGWADVFIERIKSAIIKTGLIEKIQITGSLRRKKSFIHDLDILVMPVFNKSVYDLERSHKLLKKFEALDFIKRRISTEEKNNTLSSRFETAFGIELEIIVSSHARWCIDLFNTTGSKAHVEAIKNLADKKNISLDKDICCSCLPEYDLQDSEVYKMLGIEYIEPELRENKGEIELSCMGRLPKLIKQADIKGDMHIHSSWSDGLIELEELLAKSREHNYSYLAITDHSVSNKYGYGLSAERLGQKAAYIKQIRQKIKEPCILLGAEVDITGKDRLDYDADILKGIDFVLASMHSNYLNTKAENTLRVVSAVKNRYVDAIAHPTGVVFGARAPYDLEMEEIFSAAVISGKALEINSYFLRLDLNDEYVRSFKEMGGKLLIDTDSHRIANLDMIKFGVDVARRAGLEKDDVLNTMELEELLKWKKSRIANHLSS
ncbi:MAG: hypothetical protein JW997_04805 [Actinobacteria bacterium]|nr:hypothetical protein [Actinomycetota bacterium]